MSKRENINEKWNGRGYAKKSRISIKHTPARVLDFLESYMYIYGFGVELCEWGLERRH